MAKEEKVREIAMRAKVRLNTVKPFLGEGNKVTQEKLVFFPMAKSEAYPADGSDEDNTYAKFTPSGRLELDVANPDLLGAFDTGEEFYVEFIRVKPRAPRADDKPKEAA